MGLSNRRGLLRQRAERSAFAAAPAPRRPARNFRSSLARLALLLLTGESALGGAGCAGLLGIDNPEDRLDASVPAALDASLPDAPASPIVSAPDAADESAIDASLPDAADASASAPIDAAEGGALSDQDCGVCTPGTAEACGTAGTQTCTRACRWGPCSVPNTVGCSDLTRDAFVDAAFPHIAGCLGDWDEGSMRAPKTGVACGNDLAIRCAAPADLCAPGWHVCGTPPYGPADISAQLSNAQCIGEANASFLAALGDVECEPCSSTGFGAVCCGTTCIQQNGSCVWPNATPWVGVISGHMNLCSDVYNTYPTTMGALCCAD